VAAREKSERAYRAQLRDGGYTLTSLDTEITSIPASTSLGAKAKLIYATGGRLRRICPSASREWPIAYSAIEDVLRLGALV
jgi:hypothetical protein